MGYQEVFMQAANGGKEEWKEAIDKARDLMNEGKREMSRAAGLAKEKGQEVWEIAQKKGQEAWDEARKAGMVAWGDAKERGEEAWEDTEKLIRKYPSRAIGLTLLVGVVIGALMSRDRD